MLNVAIIGQGESGKDIHGAYFLSDRNAFYRVKYIVETDKDKREEARKRYEGCEVFEDYSALFNLEDVDLIVNTSYSNLHYPITKDLLLHGKNVLVEKPFAKSTAECDDLIKTAKDKGAFLAVFQNSQTAPYYQFAQKLIKDGTLGKIEQVSIRFNRFAQRSGWRTMKKNLGGSVYSLGPHSIGMALGFLGFDKDVKVVYSKIAKTLTCGDGDDYAKIILTAPNKPLVDIEISSIDAFADYSIKLQGGKGTFKSTLADCVYKYIVDEEKEDVHTSDKLNMSTERLTFEGTALDIGTAEIYKDVYYALTENKPLRVTNEQAKMIIDIIERVFAQNV